MLVMKVKIRTEDPDLLPHYKTAQAAGADLMAACDGMVEPHGRKLIGTGVFLEIPKGFEGQIRPRSGLALKQGIGMLNAPGTIDSDYRGELGVILYNSTDESFHYKKGDRIAQIVFAEVTRAEFESVAELSATERGEGGFGSTGLK